MAKKVTGPKTREVRVAQVGDAVKVVLVTPNMTVLDTIIAAGYNTPTEGSVFGKTLKENKSVGVKLTAPINGFSALVLTSAVNGGNK